MMKIVLATIGLIAAVSACADTELPANPEFKAGTNAQCKAGAVGICTNRTVTFRCESSPTAECYFLVFFTRCSNQGVSVKDDEFCVTRKLDRFSLKVGESKVVDDLPSTFNHCTDINPIAGLQACMAKPVQQ